MQTILENSMLDKAVKPYLLLLKDIFDELVLCSQIIIHISAIIHKIFLDKL